MCVLEATSPSLFLSCRQMGGFPWNPWDLFTLVKGKTPWPDVWSTRFWVAESMQLRHHRIKMWQNWPNQSCPGWLRAGRWWETYQAGFPSSASVSSVKASQMAGLPLHTLTEQFSIVFRHFLWSGLMSYIASPFPKVSNPAPGACGWDLLSLLG